MPAPPKSTKIETHPASGIIAAAFTAIVIHAATGNPNFATASFLLLSLTAPRFAAAMLAAAILAGLTAPFTPIGAIGGILIAQMILAPLFALRGQLLHPALRGQGHPRMIHAFKKATALALLACAMLLLYRNIFYLYPLAFLLSLAALYRALDAPPVFRPISPANLAVLALSILLAAGLLETGARLLLPDLTQTTGCFQRDPEYLYTTVPNARGVQKARMSGDTYADFHINLSAQGLRDRTFPPKAPGEFRILALGDSYTFGWGVEVQDTYPKILEEMLRQQLPGARITVINAGVGGYGTWQEHGFLLEKGLPLEPDLVLLQTYTTNDMEDCLRKEGRFLRAYDPALPNQLRNFAHETLWQVRLDQWVARHCKAYRVLSANTSPPITIERFLGNIRGLPLEFLPRLPKPEPRNPTIESHLAQWYPELDHAWSLMQKEVLALRQSCLQKGIPLIAFDIPARFSVCQWEWDAITAAHDESQYDRTKCERLIRGFFQEAGIEHLDTFAAFQHHPDPESLYFRWDGHLTPGGYRFLAKLLMDHLLQEYLPFGETNQ